MPRESSQRKTNNYCTYFYTILHTHPRIIRFAYAHIYIYIHLHAHRGMRTAYDSFWKIEVSICKWMYSISCMCKRPWGNRLIVSMGLPCILSKWHDMKETNQRSPSAMNHLLLNACLQHTNHFTWEARAHKQEYLLTTLCWCGWTSFQSWQTNGTRNTYHANLKATLQSSKKNQWV